MFQIRKVLVSKQMDEERLEKVRKLRDLRKYGKKVQAEVRLKREKDKKDMLDEVRETLQGGPSGHRQPFVDIKLKVPPHYELLILLSATLTSMSTKGCPDGPPCTSTLKSS